MSSLSDASASTRRPERPRSTRLWVAAILAVGVLLLAFGLLVLMALMRVWGGEVGLVHAALVLTAFFTGVLVLGAAALGWHAGVRLTRERLSEPLREARMQIHLLGQLQGEWLWATDAEHRLVRWQAPQGAPSSAWVGPHASTQTLWERFRPADPGPEASAAQTLMRQRLDAHQPFADLELRSTDGGGLWRLRGLPAHDAQGHFSGYFGTAQSGERAAPTHPGASNAVELTAEQESFSYTVSHDLRAPLRVVEGFARILKEDYGRLLDRIGNDHLDRVLAAAARMNSMIDALLTLSQLSTRPLARQPVNLSQLANYVMEDLHRSAPERELHWSCQPDLVAQGDPTLLRMVLENLLANAWKYSAKADYTDISFSARQIDGRRVLVVEDNGAGFDMRFAERLFGVFQRLHSASEFQGTGVGLALVRRIVRRHGGDIWAESAVGEGAKFYFTLG